MRVIRRAEWGARHADSYLGYTAPLPKRWGYLHHDTGPSPAATATFNEDAAAIRAIEQVGQDRFGYGISYSFLITRSGRVFEGHRRNGVGTHTHGYNSSTLAVCFVGNYEEIEPTQEQLNAAAWLLRHGKAKGWTTDGQLDGGHRDLKATACPGINAYRLIPEINRRAQEDDMPSAKEIVDEFLSRDIYELPFKNPKNQHLRFKWFQEFIGHHAWSGHKVARQNRAAIKAMAKSLPDDVRQAVEDALADNVTVSGDIDVTIGGGDQA